MLQQRDVDHAIDFRHADRGAEVADRLGRVAAAAQPANGRHPRIVPTAHKTVLDQFQQPPLAHHGIGEIQPGELDLLRGEDAQLADVPIVERPVILELQRADRVGDPLDRVGLAVGEIVGRVDAPLVAAAVVRGVEDAVHHRVAHVQVGRGHVDLRPQGARAVGELAGPHPLEQVQVLLDRAVAVGAVLAGLGQACRDVSRTSSAFKSQTYALPALISCTAHS